MSFVKICGLSTPDTLDAALDAGADIVGFVFFAPSPRNIALADAADLGRQVQRRALKVALTVDAGEDELDRIALTLRPDLLQLHGRESPERVAAIRGRYGLPVIKAFGVASAADLAGIAAYDGLIDWVMVDAKPPRGSALPGGNGVAFDWSLLDGLDHAAPLMLSGGLTPDSVGPAIARVQPAGVDVSSGVESRPGIKSPERIAAFVAAARRAFAVPACQRTPGQTDISGSGAAA